MKYYAIMPVHLLVYNWCYYVYHFIQTMWYFTNQTFLLSVPDIGTSIGLITNFFSNNCQMTNKEFIIAQPNCTLQCITTLQLTHFCLSWPQPNTSCCYLEHKAAIQISPVIADHIEWATPTTLLTQANLSTTLLWPGFGELFSTSESANSNSVQPEL